MDPGPRMTFNPVAPGSRSYPFHVLQISFVMRLSAVVLAFLLLFVGRAAADYDDGLRAYESGDYAVAAQEWLMAASHGDAESQFRLAQLYERGLGAPQDFVQAHRWYNLAASQGNAEARKARDTLGSRLTTDQLAEAQRLATQTEALPRVDLKRPALSVADPRAVAAIGRFDGRWSAGAKLHFSSPRMKCGYQVIRLGILDGRVKGSLHIASSHFRDAAAGDYPLSGTIDQHGHLQAKGRGVAIAGVVSDEDLTFVGTWDAFGVGCKGTYEGSKEF